MVWCYRKYVTPLSSFSTHAIMSPVVLFIMTWQCASVTDVEQRHERTVCLVASKLSVCCSDKLPGRHRSRFDQHDGSRNKSSARESASYSAISPAPHTNGILMASSPCHQVVPTIRGANVIGSQQSRKLINASGQAAPQHHYQRH